MSSKREFIGEMLGAFVLVLFGCGSVAVTILFGAHQGLMQVALAWGMGVGLAIYLTRHLSGAHLNPAVSLAMVAGRRMSAKKLPTYLAGQLLGAVVAGFVLYALFSPSIAAYEAAHGIVRGTPASVHTAMMFGEYYPNPGSTAIVSMPLAIGVEAFGTFLLVLMIFALTEGSNVGRPDNSLAPVFIGITITSIICLLAPLTQAGLNPARDFGPRLVSWAMGWGDAAFPDHTGGFFFVYILGPILGGQLAAQFFVRILEPAMKGTSVDGPESRPTTIGEVKDMKTRLILVGGFLGAGKTTLLWEAAQRLARRDLRVGLITNDQAPELVDTALLARGAPEVAEVSGSCFCCNFPGLLNAMAKLRSDANADVLIAEPVGSCTDLSATIVQPLKDQMARDLAVAPLSVMVDPHRLADILNGGTAELHQSAAYIYRKQLEEADFIVISKTDLIAAKDLDELRRQTSRVYPLATIFAVSAQTGEGLEGWLDAVLQSTNSGRNLAEIDYDIYAEGEAVLGWLNATFRLQGASTNWNSFLESFLGALSKRFDSMGASVGHVKIMVEAGGDFVVGNLTGKASTMGFRGSEMISSLARMTVNARVEMSPETLEAIVREELAVVTGEQMTATQLAWRCLSPGRPEPTHRYDHIVGVG